MPIALNPKEPFEYVLRCDRNLPEEQRTVFLLLPLTVAEDFSLQNRISRQASSVGVAVGDMRRELLQRGLVGVRNFRAPDGSDVPFDTDASKSFGGRHVVSDAFLDRLSSLDRTELAEAIQTHNRVSEDERKNS